MDKRKISSPSKDCRYGSLCFRQNPAHFDEYSHPHLDAILRKGADPKTGEYHIPNSSSKDKILGQLKIVKSKQLPPIPKIPKLDKSSSDSNDKEAKKDSECKDSSNPAASASSSSPFFFKSPNTSKAPSTPNASNFLNSPRVSALQRKQEEKTFFKARNEEFKANNSENSLPSSPPKPPQNSFNPSNEKQLEEAMKQFLPVILPRGKMAEKLKNAAPYNMFLTTVTAAPETHKDPLSVTFQELLDSSLGELESSVQINFMVDIAWLLAQYAFAKCSKQPLLILCGQEEPMLNDINKKRPNITSIRVQIPTPIGVHHTKMMLMFYTDKSMRVVVSTANLYEDDWDNRVQGLWISETLPPLPDGVSHVNNGESVTKFREDLTRYLIKYDLPKLQPIIAKMRGIDFSSVNVFFVSSTPGSHRDDGKGIHFGHPRVATLLTQHSAPIDDANPIILQASSIGSLGSSASAYLTGEIATSFRKDSAPVGLRRMPNVKFIYPSLNNVLSSHDGMAGGGCLPYNGTTHEKQPWLNDFLYQWKATSRNRNSAMPHIKSYCRNSDRGLYWFILTSANLSRSAWGTLSKNKQSLNTSLRINSYEAGVVFFPRIVIGKDRFPTNEAQQKDDTPIFKLPYDIPPVPYGKLDVPYCTEYLKAYLAKYGAS